MTGSSAVPPPVWLLDIDGVVNACVPKPDSSVWPADTWRLATVHGFPILVASPVVEFIRRVHDSGRADIRWHTTWQHNAQLVADEFGLPELPVAEAPEFVLRSYDPALHGRDTAWWKRATAERVLTDEKRPLIWTDDDITRSLEPSDRAEIRALGPALLISPSDRTGLTPKHLHRIETFLDRHRRRAAKTSS
jgi:hypothetical protein